LEFDIAERISVAAVYVDRRTAGNLQEKVGVGWNVARESTIGEGVSVLPFYFCAHILENSLQNAFVPCNPTMRMPELKGRDLTVHRIRSHFNDVSIFLHGLSEQKEAYLVMSKVDFSPTFMVVTPSSQPVVCAVNDRSGLELLMVWGEGYL
jgi:hypothetical protein